jgi:hypothetical protein
VTQGASAAPDTHAKPIVRRANLNPPAYVTDPATGKVTHKFNSRRDAVFPVHTDMNLW